jgi:hypothetical protein
MPVFAKHISDTDLEFRIYKEILKLNKKKKETNYKSKKRFK